MSSSAGAAARVAGDLACSSGPHQVRVHLEDGRMRLDLDRLRTLATIARSARAVGGLRALVERLPMPEVELALRGNVIARRSGRHTGRWRVRPVGLLRGLGART